MKRYITITLLTLVALEFLMAKPYPFTSKGLKSHPPRIIRTCCAFGISLKIVAVPFYSYTEITGFDQIGPHKYLGSDEERNGNLYTRCGGFIDMGHLRDVADWTAYIYSVIQKNRYNGETKVKIGYEGGDRILKFNIPAAFTDEDIILLAGRIAYDISVWHEIATWFGVKSVPLVPEKFSSFSVEDCYSNLLGALLGMEALRSELSYEDAMTFLLDKKLRELGVLKTIKETYDATEAVRNIWWTRSVKLPNPNVLLVRYTDVYNSLKPMLIPEYPCSQGPYIIKVPEKNHSDQLLTGFYKLEFHLNQLFPLERIFPEKKIRIVTQNDFAAMIAQIDHEVKTEMPNIKL